MRVLDKAEFEVFRNIHLGKLHQGAVFIYPTDTIYGIGCDATNGEAIEKIRQLKERPDQPFSVIAPSLDWIYENCEVDKYAAEWLKKLPGPYTFVLKLKKKEAIHPSFNKQDANTIGIRMPEHWISEVVSEFGKPVITTSTNKHGEETMQHPDDLDVEFRSDVHFAIYDGILHNPASMVVKLTNSKHEFLRERPIMQDSEIKLRKI